MYSEILFTATVGFIYFNSIDSQKYLIQPVLVMKTICIRSRAQINIFLFKGPFDCMETRQNGTLPSLLRGSRAVYRWGYVLVFAKPPRLRLLALFPRSLTYAPTIYNRVFLVSSFVNSWILTRGLRGSCRKLWKVVQGIQRLCLGV